MKQAVWVAGPATGGRTGKRAPAKAGQIAAPLMALSVALLLGGCAELNGLFNTQDAPPETEVRAGTFDPALATPAEDETFAAQPRNKPIPPKPDATALTADAPVFDPLPPLPDENPSDSVVGMSEVEAGRLFGPPHPRL